MAPSPPQWQSWARGALDLALALVCAWYAVLLTSEVVSADQPVLRIAALVLAASHGGAIAVRRLAPQGVTAWLVLSGTIYALMGMHVAFLGPAGLITLYTLAARTPRSRSLWWLGAAVTLAVASAFPSRMKPDSVALFSGLVVGAWLLGDQARRRQQEAAAHAERARQLENAREELARHAVTAERLRIARELHDVVAHSMSVVALNAGAGRMIATDDPVAAAEALTTIEGATRTALSELRQMLMVLRMPDGDATLTPLPGLPDLPHLVAGVAEAGVTVDVRVDGDRRALPVGLGLTAYRIIQEALTNTLRHSAATSATVLVHYGSVALELRVCDPGPARAGREYATQDGTGLVGMRERVMLYGGEITVGTTSNGGFDIDVRIPVQETPP